MDTSPRTVRVAVDVRLWGQTDVDLKEAESHARHGRSRDGWDFGEPERTVSAKCPLDTRDRTALAADAGYGWAYTVHRRSA